MFAIRAQFSWLKKGKQLISINQKNVLSAPGLILKRLAPSTGRSQRVRGAGQARGGPARPPSRADSGARTHAPTPHGRLPHFQDFTHACRENKGWTPLAEDTP